MAEPDEKTGDNPTLGEPGQSALGRVEIDSRGRNVWRWAKDLVESTSVLLKRLDSAGLSLEPTARVPVLKGNKKDARTPDKGGTARTGDPKPMAVEQPPRRQGGGGGFDPYNSGK